MTRRPRFEPKSEYAGWPIDKIDVSRCTRPVNEQAVRALMSSIETIGLLNPILVDFDDGGDGCTLRAGRHRLEACRRLGWERIPFRSRRGQCVEEAEQTEEGEEHALCEELASIDENLIRLELTALERATAIARRKEIYEALHPGAKKGAAPKAKPSGQQVTKDPDSGSLVTEQPTKSFLDDTAARINRDCDLLRAWLEAGAR
jgi:hypothetical protein